MLTSQVCVWNNFFRSITTDESKYKFIVHSKIHRNAINNIIEVYVSSKIADDLINTLLVHFYDTV